MQELLIPWPRPLPTRVTPRFIISIFKGTLMAKVTLTNLPTSSPLTRLPTVPPRTQMVLTHPIVAFHPRSPSLFGKSTVPGGWSISFWHSFPPSSSPNLEPVSRISIYHPYTLPSVF